MKRCPTCNKTFSDPKLSFCIDDGTPLVIDTSADETTLVSPSVSEHSTSPPSEPLPYQPPGSYVPQYQGGKRKVWPWILIILAIAVIGLAALGVVSAILLPNILRARANQNNSSVNANVNQRRNSNLNSNSSPDNENASVNDETKESTPAPTDEAVVLADLTDLENEWTVANINADKKKLDRILADDYVGTLSDGASQGKADYLRTIERDDTIQKWEFEDLKVNLKGDRATLTGVVNLQIQNEEQAFRFTDKFVWRDGRWQATSSEVSRVK